MIRVLFVHQSADLYGSDRTLLYLVARLDRQEFYPTVLLIAEGPLAAAFRQRGVEVHVAPLLKMSRKNFSIPEMLKMPVRLIHSLRRMHALLKDKEIDIVHTNTLAVLSGAFWAKLRGIPHIWHVHEIIERPAVVNFFLPRLAAVLSKRVVANSHATLKWLVDSAPKLGTKGLCIWNGIQREAPVDAHAAANIRKQLNVGEKGILVALVGRINRWKGQALLVDAAELLFSRGRTDIHYLIVGSTVPQQEHLRESLLSRIESSSARQHITLSDYRPDIWPVWDACDIAVVPSTEPEPFGLVAVEAMAAGKPVIASSQGGVREIVVDGETGCLFEPGNAAELAAKIALLSDDQQMRGRMGDRGRARQLDQFSLSAHVAAFQSLYREIAVP